MKDLKWYNGAVPYSFWGAPTPPLQSQFPLTSTPVPPCHPSYSVMPWGEGSHTALPGNLPFVASPPQWFAPHLPVNQKPLPSNNYSFLASLLEIPGTGPNEGLTYLSNSDPIDHYPHPLNHTTGYPPSVLTPIMGQTLDFAQTESSTIIMLVAELVLCKLGHSITTSKFKTYRDPDPQNVLNLLKSISEVIRPFATDSFFLMNLSREFHQRRQTIQELVWSSNSGRPSDLMVDLDEKCKSKCQLSMMQLAQVVGAPYVTSDPQPQAPTHQYILQDQVPATQLKQGWNLSRSRCAPCLGGIQVRLLNQYQTRPAVNSLPHFANSGLDQVVSKIPASCPSISSQIQNGQTQRANIHSQPIISLSSPPHNEKLDTVGLEQSKTPPAPEEDEKSDTSQELEDDPSEILDSLQKSGYYLHPEFRRKLGKKSMIVRASRLLFSLQTPTAQDERHLLRLYQNNRGRSLCGNFAKQVILYKVMTEGFRQIQGLGITVNFENIKKWIKNGIKAKKVSGRPVRHAMFDKVAMGSIKRLLDGDRLPKLDNIIIEEIQNFIGGNSSKNSYGWKRKFKKRFKRYKDSMPEYFDFPLPDNILSNFIGHMVASLKGKERYLRSKKPGLYKWAELNK